MLDHRLGENGPLGVNCDTILSKSANNLDEMKLVTGVVWRGDEEVIEAPGRKKRPDRSRSMRPWKVERALPSPKGIFTNSKRPKGMMVAELRMSSGNLSIWK